MIWTIFFHLLAYGAALVLLTKGGNLVCRMLLKMCGLLPALAQTPSAPPPAGQTPAPQPRSPSPKAGRLIGSLERSIIMIGLVVGSWEIMAAVIALKTVARFKELDERIEAEYFLVGSLASILWAITVTALTLWYDRTVGLDISGGLVALVKSAA